MNIRETFRTVKAERIHNAKLYREYRRCYKESQTVDRPLGVQVFREMSVQYFMVWRVLRRLSVQIGGNCCSYTPQKSCSGGAR